jgi:hypothetical protein
MELQKIEGKIGTIGTYEESISADGVLKLLVGVEINLVEEAKKLAAKTETPIDDQAIAWLEKLMLLVGK